MERKVIFAGQHGVEVVEVVEQEDPAGKWEVRVNGKVRQWWAMPNAAIRSAKKYNPATDGFGGCFNGWGM